MYFMHILTKIQLKNLKQLFDWGEETGSLGLLATCLLHCVLFILILIGVNGDENKLYVSESEKTDWK